MGLNLAGQSNWSNVGISGEAKGEFGEWCKLATVRESEEVSGSVLTTIKATANFSDSQLKDAQLRVIDYEAHPRKEKKTPRSI